MSRRRFLRQLLPALLLLAFRALPLGADGRAGERDVDRAWEMGRASFFERLRAGASRLMPSDDRDALAYGAERLPDLYDRLMNYYFYQGDVDKDAPDFGASCVGLSERMAEDLIESVAAQPEPAPGASRLEAVLASAGYFANNDYPFYKKLVRKRTGLFKWNWAVDALKLRRVRALSQGEGVRIAVIDSGVDASISEIKARTRAWKNFLDGSLPPWDQGHFPYDRLGHGTMIATLAYETAPRSDFLFVKVVDPSTLGGPPVTIWTASLIAAGIVWAAEHGADVISLSLAIPWDAPPLRRAVRACWDKNVLIVAAQGNARDAADPVLTCYPAAYPEAIAVSGIEKSAAGLKPWTYSGRAPYIDFAAPACDLWADWPSNLSVKPAARSAFGNSFAVPIAAGAAALVLAAMDAGLRAELRAVPGRLVETVRSVLRRTASNDIFGLATPNDQTGYGLIDIEAALRAMD